ncbi:hypothetical protein LO762_21905 [Actinocorallia sp. API 0066]|uniref:hypothetical protein n=1 Tax=Actinocorallia sp. API 0066 TaxID=2896846 RepID=UPI001E58936E|nr:hypothetical protein [Actinocorallia sp. API 0066]MCD0451829.1 hypothetical protein [Actinocorallia sp. API 0066]
MSPRRAEEISGIFDDMLVHARELLAVRSPLDAELIVSEILGAWYGGRSGRGDVERVVGEALLDHAVGSGTPAALALLSGVAQLGTPRQQRHAERGALRLMGTGVARPPWAERLNLVQSEACYLSRDVYGDQKSVICTFTYGGEERHALVVLVDENLGGRWDIPAEGGLVRDAWVSSHVDRLLDHCRAEAAGELMEFDEMDPHETRALLEPALDLTGSLRDAPVSDTFASYHALLRARVRILPPGGRRPPLPAWSGDRKATLGARFLASEEAGDLSDLAAAGRCVDRIIDYGCARDFGRPLRVSPIKCEMFLLDWLPRKVFLSPAEQEAMPHVLAAWVRWAARRTGLPQDGVRATLDAVWDATHKFSEAYRDPSASGLDRALVAKLLPDGDLEALPRRAFALPFLTGELAALDPADSADRRTMLAYEHPGATEAELDGYERLADRLWKGDPPELWETTQRLLDEGGPRHLVVHALMRLVVRYDADRPGLRRALRKMRPEDL